MYTVHSIHIYKDEKGVKQVCVTLECTGEGNRLSGTWADHLVTVTVPYAKPEQIVPLLKKRIAEEAEARREEAVFLHTLRDAMKKVNTGY